jgi:transposase-like protein
MARLTKKQKKEYIENKGVICPFCKSRGIEGGFAEIDAGGASQHIRCLDCDQTWTDYYTLTTIQPDEELLEAKANEELGIEGA